MEAKYLLAIKTPELLFSNEINKAKNEWHFLSKQWHPDKNNNPVAAEVFAHIKELYSRAIDKIKTNTWEIPGEISFNCSDSVKKYKYDQKLKFDYGNYYLSGDKIIYVFNKEHNLIFLHAHLSITNIKFANKKMEKTFRRLFPYVIETFADDDKKHILIIKKPKGTFLLREVIEYFNNKIDPKHVAWIGSRLYSIATCLKHCNAIHLEISPDTCFVDSANHDVFLLGGWEYSTRPNKKIEQVSARTYSLLPESVKKDKECKDYKAMLELIKATLRECLGDIEGSKLLMNKDIPRPMLSFLFDLSVLDPIKDYETWYKVLEDCFGPRKFIKMEINK